jgi:hypothetical protein
MKSAPETLEDRIRERAYYLWEASGRPPGREVEFWHRACEMVATGDDDQPKSRAQRRKAEQTKSTRPPGKRTRQIFRTASQVASISPD